MSIKEWLIANNRTQKWLGERVGLSQARISQIMNYGTDSLSIALAIRDATKRQVKLYEMQLRANPGD